MDNTFPPDESSLLPDSAPSAGDEGALDSQAPDQQGPSVDGPLDQQKTVISSRPPIGERHIGGSAGTQEVGRQLEGRHLDHFQLDEFIGGGGMGAVFRATDLQLGRVVAVKVLSRRTDDEMLWRFKNEAQSAARLDHGNIARVYYVGEDDGWHFIVFEFISGVNIRDLVHHKGPLGLDEAFSYVLQIADALQHAFQREVVHRDIKPSNILVSDDGHAKLVDMGLARLHQVKSDSADVTASGVTLGTFDYISPEQARDPRNTDVRSDVYSLGCTLYFMLTGAPPFPEGTVLQKLLSHSSEPPPDARLYRSDLDDSVVQILERMLAKRPDDRYQTPSELIGDLIAAAERLGLPTAQHGTVWVAPNAQPNGLVAHLPWVVPAVLLLIGAISLERWSRTQPAAPLPNPRFAKAPYLADAPSDPEPPADEPPNTDTPDEPMENTGSETSSDMDMPPNTTSDSGDPEVVVDPPGEDESVLPQRTVVVGTVTGPVPENTVTVATLQAALMELDKDLTVTAIEIRSNDVASLRPLDLQLANRSRAELAIRGGPGYTPRILFAPTADDASSQHPAMIGVHGGELTLENVHLELQLPSFHRESWAIMQLNEIKKVTLKGVSCTVRQPAGDRLDTVSDEVSMFEWSLPNPTSMMPVGEEAVETMMGLAEIDMEGCIVRGPVAITSSAEGVPFRLRWTEGWLASSRAVMEMKAATTRPRWKDGGVELLLDHVTALAAGGICRLAGDQRTPYPVEITARLHSCIVITAPDQPLFLLQGVSVFDDPPPPPKIHGAFNYYHNTDLVLSIVHRDEPDDPENYTFDFLGKHRSEQYIMQWYNELYFRPGASLNWRSEELPSLALPEKIVTSDLLLEEYQSDSVDIIPGFHPSRLPTLITPAPLAPAGPAGEGSP